MSMTHAAVSAAASSATNSNNGGNAINGNDHVGYLSRFIPPAQPINDVPYLLHMYCHDDPKKLTAFRLKELDALCQLTGVSVPCYDPSTVVQSSPFVRARFPNESCIRTMAARSILTKGWLELWAHGDSIDACIEQLRQRKDEARFRHYTDDAALTYDIRVHTFGASCPAEEIVRHRTALIDALGFKGKNLVGSNAVGAKFYLYIDIGSTVINPGRTIRGVYFAREICGERFNDLETRYRLNKRVFIGPTSMPPSLCFIMANLGLVTASCNVLDPCVGTGSILIAAGHFKAQCFGSDIDWKVLHGKTRKGEVNVMNNFKQYQMKRPEIVCCDMSHNIWRGQQGESKGFIDAILSDPPYGVRAGARKLGRAEDKEVHKVPEEFLNSHVPATQVYDVEDVIHDLLDLSAQVLRMGGRLVYWLPTTTDFRDDELPAHPCLRQVCVTEQLVRNNFSRRLIVMEKWQTFNKERKMKRRNKETEPPPKYANLKETLLQLSEGRASADGSAAGSASIAASPSPTTPASSPDSSPPPDAAAPNQPTMSQRSKKRLAKLQAICAAKAAAAVNAITSDGKKLSKKERIALKQRLPVEEYRAIQKEKYEAIRKMRSASERNNDENMNTNEDAETSSAAAASSSTVPRSHSPPSPDESAHASKKAKHDTKPTTT